MPSLSSRRRYAGHIPTFRTCLRSWGSRTDCRLVLFFLLDFVTRTVSLSVNLDVRAWRFHSIVPITDWYLASAYLYLLSPLTNELACLLQWKEHR